MSEMDRIQWKTVAKFHRETTSESPNSHTARSQFPAGQIDAQGRKIRGPASWQVTFCGEAYGAFLPRLFGIRSGARRLNLLR
jgi:hypothetical protein